MWKLYYEDLVRKGHTREDWDALPVTGVQVLIKKLDPDKDGKSRVAWRGEYTPYLELLSPTKGAYKECTFYAWIEDDDAPAGVTPDAVLDFWAHYTNQTDVTVGDLSLEDLHSIGVKVGRSLSDEKFNAIWEKAINDPEIP